MIIFISPLVVFTIYLLYVRFNKTKLAAINQKHHKESKNYELYKLIYSQKTLVLVGSLSLLLVGNFIVHVFITPNGEKSTGATLLVAILTLLPIGLLFYWSKKDRASK